MELWCIGSPWVSRFLVSTMMTHHQIPQVAVRNMVCGDETGDLTAMRMEEIQVKWAAVTRLVDHLEKCLRFSTFSFRHLFFPSPLLPITAALVTSALSHSCRHLAFLSGELTHCSSNTCPRISKQLFGKYNNNALIVEFSCSRYTLLRMYEGRHSFQHSVLVSFFQSLVLVRAKYCLRLFTTYAPSSVIFYKLLTSVLEHAKCMFPSA